VIEAHRTTPAGRQRARGLGLQLQGTPGTANAITDVAGVEVGTVTLVEGEGTYRGDGPVRTGVTALLPRGRHGLTEPCTAGLFSMNGNGEVTGSHWLAETGLLTSPIALTNTHAVGAAHRGVIDWTVGRLGVAVPEWLLPVVAETWDGYLHDVYGRHVTPEHAMAALDAARGGPVEEGSVGGGTGMQCYGFKGGNGTASRRVPVGDHQYVVGVLLQANFGRRNELVVTGVPVGAALAGDDPMADDATWPVPSGTGSVIVVVATDAPLLPHQCSAMARRVPLGLARTGTTGSHYSGDIFVAFSTANRGTISNPGVAAVGRPPLDELQALPWSAMDPLFRATVEAVEEAVLDALIANETMWGSGRRYLPALPHDRLLELLARH
jgi:L-aminopeptidase/D-esterase-like protein